MRLRDTAWLGLLFLSGCVQPGCNIDFDDCEYDYECSRSAVCDEGFLGKECMPVQLCEDGCQPGESCVTRSPAPAGNPFDSPHAGKRVCECPYGEGNCGYGGSGGYGGYGGSGGYGASAGSGGSGGVVYACLEAPPTGEPLSGEAFGDASAQGGPRFAVDYSDNVFTALQFQGKVDLGGGELTSAGDTDVGILVRDPLGDPLWTARFGNEGPNPLTAFSVFGSYVTAAITWKGVLDLGAGPHDAGAGEGAVAMMFVAGTPAAPVAEIFVTSDTSVSITGAAYVGGSIAVAGTFEGTLDLGGEVLQSAGGKDAFVARYDFGDGGALLGSYQLGGAGDQYASFLKAGFSGDLLVGGGFEGQIDLDGAQVTADGQDAFLFILDETDAVQWSRVIGGPDRQLVIDALYQGAASTVIGASAPTSQSGPVTIDLGEGATLVGAGAVDGFVAAFDAQGKLTFADLMSAAPGTGEVTPKSIQRDCEQDFIIAGTTTPDFTIGDSAPTPGFGERDAFAVKLDTHGNLVWTRLLGGPENDGATDVLPIGGKELWISGTFEGTMSIGQDELVSQGAEDAFIGRLQP